MTGVNDLNRKFVETQMELRDHFCGADRWAQAYLRRFYSPNPSGLALINISFSVESLILTQVANFELLTLGRVSDEVGEEIAKLAPSDYDCNLLARQLVLSSATSSWVLPKSLHQFAKEVTEGAKFLANQGSRYWKIRVRNQVGAMTLLVLTDSEGYALDAMRNTATAERRSACDVLAQVTSGRGWASITYDAATEIWRNRERLVAEYHCSMILDGATQLNSKVNRGQAFSLLGVLSGLPLASGRKTKT